MIKRSLIIAGIVAAVLSVLMVFTNPDESDFIDFISMEVEKAISSYSSTVSVEDSPGVASEIAARFVEDFTSRKSFGICSIYTVSVPGKEWKYLGVFKCFIPLQQDSPLDFIKQ